MKETLELMLEIAEISDNIREAEKAGEITHEQAQAALSELLEA